MEIKKERPPFVIFETRSDEDRNATIEKGHYVGRDVDYAIITPAGSKDRIERVVEEWFAKLQQDAADGRFPLEWLQAYRNAYKSWKEGQGIPENGTPLKDWPGLSPSQLKLLLSIHVRTVEDLAAANEEVISRIGMGGRALVQRASDFLRVASSTGRVGEELSALRASKENLEMRNTQLETQIKELTAKVNALTAAAPQTPATPPPASHPPIKL